jgi:L-cysteate sulfo-lyase
VLPLLATALGNFPRERLLDGQTAIQRLHRLERTFSKDARGVRFFVKRDDLMGLGGGGNKLRKLEFTIGEALARGCDALVTSGGVQSNHARLSAAAAAKAGLSCDLVLTRAVPRDDKDYQYGGNVLLDQLFGAKIHKLAEAVQAGPFVEDLVRQLRGRGRRPYVLGMGGSSPVGCLGYVACAAEIASQERELGTTFAAIVTANGSSGTHAGLAAGFRALGHDPARVASFAVLASAEETRATTLDLARRTLALIDDDATLDAAQIVVSGEELGGGYGLPTENMRAAVRRLARCEGLLLDPVYSGKAFAGVLAEIERGNFKSGDAVLFLMTGGLPGLFAYRRAFS